MRRLAPDGLEAWGAGNRARYEGNVAQDEARPYTGGPTRRWLKVKRKDRTVAEDGWRRRISLDAVRRGREAGPAAATPRRLLDHDVEKPFQD